MSSHAHIGISKPQLSWDEHTLTLFVMKIVASFAANNLPALFHQGSVFAEDIPLYCNSDASGVDTCHLATSLSVALLLHIWLARH